MSPSPHVDGAVAKGIQDERYQSLMATLRAARAERGLTQSDVAAALQTRQQFVSKYESGERRLDVIEFVDVACALGLDWSELLNGVTHKVVE